MFVAELGRQKNVIGGAIAEIIGPGGELRGAKARDVQISKPPGDRMPPAGTV